MLSSRTSDISWFLLKNPKSIARTSVHLQVCPPWGITQIPYTDSRTISHPLFFLKNPVPLSYCNIWLVKNFSPLFTTCDLLSLLQKYNLKGLLETPSFNNFSVLFGSAFVALILFYSMWMWVNIIWGLLVPSNIKYIQTGWNNNFFYLRSQEVGHTSSIVKELEFQISVTLQFFHSVLLHVLASSSKMASFMVVKLASNHNFTSNHNFLLHMWQLQNTISHYN